ncbi:Aldehyde/histidinol dehydrogenase [Trichophaea hybrida]|nr:Aldehyde/histidinol dehydrogenase [Trichophaea hybrida]
MSSTAPASPADIARMAALASRTLKAVKGADRDAALTAVHSALERSKDVILAANKKDMEAAQNLVDAGKMRQSLVRRLFLSQSKWDGMLEGILDVRNLEDPVGKVTLATKLDDGLDLYRLTCPIGVLLVIFEARPEVIANITALALNVNSFAAIAQVVSEALATTSIPPGAVQLVETREDVNALLDQDQYIDLVIPRGQYEIPVMGHADGLCAIYVHSDAKEEKSVKVVVDAKTDYPAACNAVETLLAALEASTLDPAKKVILQDSTNQDYDTEFLELTVAVKEVAESFMNRVDSAGVFWNVSTRFADGFRYGFGTEVGISTNKIHARGPVGLEGLTIHKYQLRAMGKGPRTMELAKRHLCIRRLRKLKI